MKKKQNQKLRKSEGDYKKYNRQLQKTKKTTKLQKKKQYELKKEVYVNGLNLYEIKTQILQEYTGDFELNELIIIGPIEDKTNIRFKKMDDFESYINAIDVDYDSEDVIFTGYIFKLNTPQFNVVKRRTYGKGNNYMQEIVEYHGKNCYIPSSGKCFIKCNNYFTEKEYTEEFLTFIRTEQRRSNVMTSARIQPFCRKNNINIGCFDGT